MKRLMLLFLILFIITGCSIKTININNIEKTIETIIKNSNNLVNTASNGYKYYIPKGVTLINSSSFNEILYYNKNYYYLYVDIVSYYNKVEVDYEENEDAYFSKKLDINDKSGYIEITKKDDYYFIEAMYNYAKIETYVKENDINESLINISYILTSIKFNDAVTKIVLGVSDIETLEEKLNIFVPKRESGTFLDYIEEYDKYEEGTQTDLEENTLGKENE
jgi:hypothetical protein